MKSALAVFTLSVVCVLAQAQPKNGTQGIMATSAQHFLHSLSREQRAKAQFPFDAEERYNWHYIPKDDRKGIPIGDLDEGQKKAAFELLHTALSDDAYTKATSIIQLEPVLKAIENRPADDHYRDPNKYYFTVFGNPSADSVWGWRLEGHHVSLNFSSENNEVVSGTPGFFGSNPAIVLSGPEKGKQILKDETELGANLLHALTDDQLKEAVISEEAPGEIFTTNSRKAMISNPQGILYTKLNESQKKLFMQLLSLYIHRYTKLFAATMMKEIETAGLNNLRFAWAGKHQPGPGNPCYYRIQGPGIIIEYDNTQNNANHVHTVIRDLNNDFGGDELMEHYKHSKH
jgi:hypothetical protein